jgi:hypothetical protein
MIASIIFVPVSLDYFLAFLNGNKNIFLRVHAKLPVVVLFYRAQVHNVIKKVPVWPTVIFQKPLLVVGKGKSHKKITMYFVPVFFPPG